jgi:hypothetical protein
LLEFIPRSLGKTSLFPFTGPAQRYPVMASRRGVPTTFALAGAVFAGRRDVLALRDARILSFLWRARPDISYANYWASNKFLGKKPRSCSNFVLNLEGEPQ